VAWKVIWTDPAWENLQAAVDYIAQDSPRYAAALVREARDAARSLTNFANRGRVVPEIDDPSIRELFVWRYRLLYRITGSEVQIVAFIHSARNLGTVLTKMPPD
jgi:plasmid stabilization system protein ParE